MTTSEQPIPVSAPAEPSAQERRRARRLTKAQQYAAQCKPFPAVAGETQEERIDRLDASLDYLSQCFQDEFEVRDEGTLLVDIISRVLIPFAALSTAASLLYVRIVQWSSVHYPSFERVAAYTYFAMLGAILLLLVYARKSGHPSWLNGLIDASEDALGASVPERKETLTRNNIVNRWIYIWIIGAFTIFIPMTFIVLRSGIADELGVQVAIDTANVCDGPGRIYLFTGSNTCVEIQEENLDLASQTQISNPTGMDAGRTSISPIETADTPIDAHIAEIRLDTTTTLALAVVLLVVGILAGMAHWWWRNHNVRDIELM